LTNFSFYTKAGVLKYWHTYKLLGSSKRIYGPVKDNSQWRSRYNKESYTLHGDTLTLYHVSNWKGFNGWDMCKGWKAHKFLRQCLKLSLEEWVQLESPRWDGKMWSNRMLPDFCDVAIGSWSLMTEHCGGRRQRMPRPDLGCSAIGWMD
jgi:hypothetical protein